MRSLAGTICEAISEMTQLRSLNLIDFQGLTAQHVKEHICCLKRIEQLGLQYDFDIEPEPSEEWDRETQDWIEVPSEDDALSAIANSMIWLRSFTLSANNGVVEQTVLPWIEVYPGLFHLQQLAFVHDEEPDHMQDTWQLMERLAAASEEARPGLQCTWHRAKEGLSPPFVGEL
jgi:hypothetical protein